MINKTGIRGHLTDAREKLLAIDKKVRLSGPLVERDREAIQYYYRLATDAAGMVEAVRRGLSDIYAAIAANELTDGEERRAK